jgi:hypothetical protein
MIFADTFYFIALLNRDDNAHERAAEFSRRLGEPLLTTEWVLTELADALASPAERTDCAELLSLLRTDPDVSIVASEAALWAKGLSLYSQRSDKAWSLTDCISFVVMRKRGLQEALTGDRHFEQAGFRALLTG